MFPFCVRWSLKDHRYTELTSLIDQTHCDGLLIGLHGLCGEPHQQDCQRDFGWLLAAVFGPPAGC